MVKGWGGHREWTVFESQWVQRMKKKRKKEKKNYLSKKNIYKYIKSSWCIENVKCNIAISESFYPKDSF